jgi:hypothetical protein
MSRRRKLILIVTVTAVMLACMPTFAPTPAPLPTFDPNTLLTAIVETANAAATQTADFAPPTATETASPTPTLPPTETATPTFFFAVATVTVQPTPIAPGSTGVEYQCQVMGQSPGNDTIIARDTEFNMVWRVTNIGTDAWLDTEVDIRYHTGARLHKSAAQDLDLTVAKGATIEVIVPMKAPSEPDIYNTEWRFYRGNRAFCPMRLKIIVN